MTTRCDEIAAFRSAAQLRSEWCAAQRDQFQRHSDEHHCSTLEIGCIGMRTPTQQTLDTCTKPEIQMLLIILIGAALSHVRPEPPCSIALPTDPQRAHRKRWRCTAGVAAFWR
jgi:hypothetical protein